MLSCHMAWDAISKTSARSYKYTAAVWRLPNGTCWIMYLVIDWLDESNSNSAELNTGMTMFRWKASHSASHNPGRCFSVSALCCIGISAPRVESTP